MPVFGRIFQYLVEITHGGIVLQHCCELVDIEPTAVICVQALKEHVNLDAAQRQADAAQRIFEFEHVQVATAVKVKAAKPVGHALLLRDFLPPV